jgi:subfamily B ATP-binding cassette protein HlyB/CyaB
MDTGLDALVALARFYQLPAEADQLAHEFGQPGQAFSDTELLQAAKALTLKAKLLSLTISTLKASLLPAIAKHNDGTYFIIARLSYPDDSKNQGNDSSNPTKAGVTDAGVLIHDLREAPRTLTLDELAGSWSGDLIAVTRRETLGASLQQHFDISWFIPSLVKYRKLFGEVLIASFFLQLFALVTPLFFQVVMDKVLVHRGFTTLDVLAIGFFVVVVFEALLGGIRNYTFSHTTNRVDVELGSRYTII